MRLRISIRGSVRRSVGPSVRNAFFVRDGIHSVADYNSTLMGVVVVLVVLVVLVLVVILFHDGITRERFELSS